MKTENKRDNIALALSTLIIITLTGCHGTQWRSIEEWREKYPDYNAGQEWCDAQTSDVFDEICERFERETGLINNK